MRRPARPMIRAARSCLSSCLWGAFGLLLAAAGCTPEAITLKKIGDACTANSDCGKMFCSKADQVCTRPCVAQTDCPSGFDCGLAHPEDGKAGAPGATCYESKVENPAAGGFGTDCGAYSPDPFKPEVVCDDLAKNPCASGFTCLGSVKCDAGAYCTRNCASDAECPPSMMCATDTAEAPCKADGDCKNGFTCQGSGAPGGKGKVCTGKKWCRKRGQCTPCGANDQCPPGYWCAIDAAGERYCGKECADEFSCPTPPTGTTSTFFACVDGNIGKTVCQPLQGACHGPSNIPDVPPGGACSWCRDGIPSDCPDSYCFSLLSDEHLCAGICTVDFVNNRADFTTDSCPKGTFCIVRSCGANCTATGFCTADPKRQNITCFPE